jgi:hypothetical protein
MPGPDVDEMDVEAVDLGRDLRQCVQTRLAPLEVVLGRPVASELTQRRQLHALRPILDELLGRQAGRRDALAEVGEYLPTLINRSFACASSLMVRVSLSRDRRRR